MSKRTSLTAFPHFTAAEAGSGRHRTAVWGCRQAALFQSCSPAWTAPSASLLAPLCLCTVLAPRHTKGLETKAGICVGGQAAARNTCLLFLCRQKKRVGNPTNERLCCGVISSCYLKLRFGCARGRNCPTIAPKPKAAEALPPR